MQYHRNRARIPHSLVVGEKTVSTGLTTTFVANYSTTSPPFIPEPLISLQQDKNSISMRSLDASRLCHPVSCLVDIRIGGRCRNDDGYGSERERRNLMPSLAEGNSIGARIMVRILKLVDELFITYKPIQ